MNIEKAHLSDLIDRDFTGVNTERANLSDTGAKTEEEVVDEFTNTLEGSAEVRNTKAK